MSDTKTLDALVIRNIADIEAAMKHAIEVIGPRIWEEASRVMQATCVADTWIALADLDEEDVWFADRNWLMPGQRKPKADFWLGLDERTSGGNLGENSWLATFVSSGPNGATMAFWLNQRILLPGAWKKLVKSSDALVAELRGFGFSFDDDDDRRLYVPVVLDREALAMAFETDDFDDVMKPVATAVANAMSAAPVLGRLRKAALARKS